MSTQAHTPGPPRPHSRRRFVESPAAAVRYSRKAGFFRSGRETPEPTPPGILWRAAWYPVAADGRRAEGNPPPRCDAPAAPVPGWGWGGGKGTGTWRSTRFGVRSGSVGGKNHGMEDGVGADGGNGGDGAPRGGPGMDSPSLCSAMIQNPTTLHPPSELLIPAVVVSTYNFPPSRPLFAWPDFFLFLPFPFPSLFQPFPRNQLPHPTTPLLDLARVLTTALAEDTSAGRLGKDA